MTKYMLAALLLFWYFGYATGAKAESMIVIGDSISFPVGSWANLWRDEPGRNLKLLAQPGRAVIDYDIPRDLHPFLGIGDVYYMIGSNDIGRNEFPAQVNLFLTAHIDLLVSRAFRVHLVIPPRFEGHEAHADKIRALYTPLCAKVYRCVDMDEIWPAVETSDGVHPTEAGQRVLLDFINP